MLETTTNANVVKNEQNERNATNIFDRDAQFCAWDLKKSSSLVKKQDTPTIISFDFLPVEQNFRLRARFFERAKYFIRRDIRKYSRA